MTGSVVAGNTVTRSSTAGTTGGGGIYFGGPGGATITASSISGNTVQAIDTSNAKANGGGIVFASPAASVIQRSTISGNQVRDDNQATALAPAGGGVYHTDSGNSQIRIVNSTLSSNSVVGDADAGNEFNFGGGAFWSSPNGANTDRIVHSTLTDNSSPRGDAIASFAFVANSKITLQSSIVDDQDGNVTDTCQGTPVSSAGHNVAMGTSCVDGSDPSDLPSTDPKLLPLGAFGGLTDTSPPKVGSPAVDLVPANACNDGASVPALLNEDQRQFPRPFDGDGDSTADCDAGAVEVYPCAGKNATRIGSPTADVMLGTPGADVMMGLEGDDRVKGKDGNDRLCGFDGDDFLAGGDGKDKLVGQKGKDRCSGGGGRDKAQSCEKTSGVP